MRYKKLLNKTLHYYVVFGILFFAIAIPSFYFFVDKNYVHEIDEYLTLQQERAWNNSLQTLTIEEISVWNHFNNDKIILPDSAQQQPTIFFTKKYYNEQEKENQFYRVSYSKIKIEGKPYILEIRFNIYEAKRNIESGITIQLLLFLCLIFGFVLITRLIYKKLWKPFYQTLRQIEQFNIRKYESPHFPETSTQEFFQLNQALEKLINNNLQAYKIQKEFTENASHEMQTPLAIFQSKLDILLQQPNLTEEQLAIIQSLYTATSRLVRMNKNLLLLAKLDNLQFLETQPLNISEVIEESLSFLSEQAEANNIQIKSNIVSSDITVRVNKVLLESLINNLITNAIKHNIPQGIISIAFKDNRLVILNTGTEKPLDETILFRRFCRMSEKTKGSGLGLAIVQQICNLYNWQVSYSFQEGNHQFIVTFHE